MRSNLIIILCHNPWKWSADFANQTAELLCVNNVVICLLLCDARSVYEHVRLRLPFVFRKKIRKGLYTFTPLYILPFRRFLFIELMNIQLNILYVRLWLLFFTHGQSFGRKLLWMFYAGYEPISKFFGKSFSVVYDCVDYFDGRMLKTKKPYLLEERLIKKARYFFVNSLALYDYHKHLRKASVVPQGFRFNDFSKYKSRSALILPKDKPIIGYIGGINYRLDFRLLQRLVARNPQYNFVFVGSVQTFDDSRFSSDIQPQIEALFQLKNCLHYSDQPKEKIPSIISKFDACFIPYDVSLDYNTYSFPMKVFEYFYIGKPVVSTDIIELRRYHPYIRIASTFSEWESAFDELLCTPWPDTYKKEQRKLAKENRWEKKIGVIESYISATDQVKNR